MFDQSANLFESICGKKSIGWMDKIKKKILIECSVTTLMTPHCARYLLAADVRYHLDCWSVWACLPGAIVTTITTSLVCCKCKQTAQMVRYCYNKYECCSIASVSDMHACMHKFTDMTTVKDMVNGQTQLLQTWLMVGCKCNIHGS